MEKIRDKHFWFEVVLFELLDEDYDGYPDKKLGKEFLIYLGKPAEKRALKEKDDLHFNCSQTHELLYVTSLYEEEPRVFAFLKQSCQSGELRYSTHRQVYEMVEKELGLRSGRAASSNLTAKTTEW